MSHAPYDGLVGGAFSCLGGGVRRAHSWPLVAEGDLRVEWSHSRLGRFLARLMRLPPEGDRVPTRLEIFSTPSGLIWVRDFGGHRVVTQQWTADGLLYEAVGPFRTGFWLLPESTGLRYVPVGVWLGPAPLPWILAAKVEANVEEAAGGWRVEVRVTHPWLGALCRYGGTMKATLECGSSLPL